MYKPHLIPSIKFLQFLALFLLAGLLLLQGYLSLGWPIAQDIPLLHYVAFMMDQHHLVPYRDIFETSMPGTFTFHYFICKLFGYEGQAIRGVDLALLGALLMISYKFISRFGRLPAIWASILFGLVYLFQGPSMSLQKDFIGVIPVAVSLLLIPAESGKPVLWPRFAAAGMLFGLAFLIKPHLVIAFPVAFGTLLIFRWDTHKKSLTDFMVCALVAAGWWLAPIILMAIWMAAHSSLVPFVDIFINYLPMHNNMTGWHEVLSNSERIPYLARYTLKLGGYRILVLCSLFAWFRVMTRTEKNGANFRSLVCLVLYTFLFALYPTIAGKFWDYHYMPLAYFLAISVGLSLYRWPEVPNARLWRQVKEVLPLLVLVAGMTLQLNLPTSTRFLVDVARGQSEIRDPHEEREGEIADWLNSHLQPGDTVQPLDWTGGSIHAMLLAEARLSSRFLYDYHFYHNISSPYNQALRASFITQIRQDPPRFVIAVDEGRPWVSGIDTSRDFPELQRFLSEGYTKALAGKGYDIFERKDLVSVTE
ncbi:MAG: hypothetical protein ABFS42_16070 [Candidatus Krumholzibacteriota bacterium]